MRNLITGVSLCLGLLWLAQGLASGQEQMTRTEIRNGKVVYVAPGTIAIRGKSGVRIFTKSEWKDIKVMRDGQVIDPDQLHKGDVVNATVISATEPKVITAEQAATYGIIEEASEGDMTLERIIWTEIKKGKVVYVSQTDLLIRGPNGVRRFSKDPDWKDTKIEKDGEMITPDKLHKGDIVTATFITKAIPTTVSEEQVATYEAPPPPAPKPKPAAAPAPAPAPAPVAAPAPEPAPAKLPKTASTLPAVGLVGVALVGLGLALAVGRRSRRA